MLYRIAGRSGTGKTEYIKTLIGEKCENNVPCVVIVPVQQSMEYEKDIFTRFGSRANLYIEVLTFDRLPNRTYREYGGLASNYIDDGGRTLLMSHALKTVKENLKEFSSVCDEKAFVLKMLETSRTLKEKGINHSLLADIEGESRTVQKARDIHTILSEYDSRFGKDRLDGRDMLDLYAENLKTMDFFKGKTVFVDSFNSFTEQQHRVLDAIAARCDELYITFNYDPEDRTFTFATPAYAFDRTGKHHKTTDIYLTENRRATNKSLEYAEKNLWDNTVKPFEEVNGIEFFKCTNPFEESECAASIISRLVREGYHYKDIVIILRSPESYAGIIDAVLEKHNIPCFFSSGDSIMVKPLTTFLLSACEAVVNNYPLHTVLKFIKSGFLPIPQKRINLLCRYAETWRIRGKAWVGDEDFLMNPSGYREVMSEYDSSLLSEVNAARKAVAEVLSQLESDLKQEGLTGENVAKALYKMLEGVNAPQSIRAKAKSLRRSGNEDASQKMTELWDVIINALDQLYLVSGKTEIKLTDLPAVLELLFDTYTVGSVPASCDEILIGNAAIFKGNNPKGIILLGVNDGVFPASPSNSGVFDSRELDELEKKGIALEDNFERQLDNERLFFYLAVSLPRERLFCVFSEGEGIRPSVGAVRLMKLFPSVKLSKFGENTGKDEIKAFENVFSPASARENSRYASGLIKKLLSEKGINDAETLSAYPLSDINAIINNINKTNITLSPTRLERYTYCGFSYFGKYLLKLQENKKAEFAHAEIGNFVHKVLEVFISSRVKGNAFLMPSDEEISEGVESITKNYIRSVCGDLDIKSKRFGYTLSRLKTTLRLLLKNVCEELSQSLFVPAGFEVTLEGNNSIYTSESGITVKLNGKIDRVDIYKKGEKTYVRVVDYKTGTKVFDRKALDNGLDLQMFLYLFAYCANIKDAVPAGVNYLPAKLEAKKQENGRKAEISEIAEASFRRSGLLLKDMDIIEAMEPGNAKRFLPVKINDDGSLKDAKNLADLEEFGKLEEKTVSYIKKLGLLISDGVMDVSPLKLSRDYDACRFCSLKAVCRLSTERSVVRHKGIFEEWEDDENGQ